VSFPSIEVNNKGEQKKRYYQTNMKMPYEKLKSLSDVMSYLKKGISLEKLQAMAMKQSDVDAWKQMQKARTKLFDDIFGQNQKAA